MIFARPILLLLAPLFFSACTTVHYAKDPLSAPAGTDDGTVLLSLTVNTGEAQQFDRIVLSRDEDPPASKSGVDRQYQLSNAVPGVSRDTALFTGVLPAGTYRFRVLHSGLKFLPLNDAQKELLGGFRVEPGQLVDLGRLVLSSINFGVMVGRSNLLTDNRSLIDIVAPQYGVLFDSPAVTGWLDTDNRSAMVEDYARAFPQGAGGFSKLADGTVVGGTRMGTILQRDTGGKWQVLARTGALDAVLYTAPYETGDYLAVAAGELNTLVKIKRDGSVEPVARGNLPSGNYLFIHRSADLSRWAIGVQEKDQASLFVSDALDNGDWQRVYQDVTSPSVWSGLRGVWFWPHGNGVGYASTASDRVACLDFETGEWVDNGSPEGRGLLAVAAGPQPVVGVLTQAGGGFAGAFAKTHYSHDCGASWVETDSPYTVKAAAPLVLPSGHILEGGGVFSDKGVYRSTDGAKSWEKITDKGLAFDSNLWVVPGLGLISVLRGLQGVETIETSTDEGATWTLEVSSIFWKLLEQKRKATAEAQGQ